MQQEGWLRRPKRFAEYLPQYMAERVQAGTRRLHVAGPSSAGSIAGVAAMRRRAWYAARETLALFSLARTRHFRVECNRSTAFKNPARAIPGALTLDALMLAGCYRTLNRIGEHTLDRFSKQWQAKRS